VGKSGLFLLPHSSPKFNGASSPSHPSLSPHTLPYTLSITKCRW